MIEWFLQKIKGVIMTFLGHLFTRAPVRLLNAGQLGIGGRIAVRAGAEALGQRFLNGEREQVGLVSADGDIVVIPRARAVVGVHDGIQHLLLLRELLLLYELPLLLRNDPPLTLCPPLEWPTL